jgi:hypothetical protein
LEIERERKLAILLETQKVIMWEIEMDNMKGIEKEDRMEI